MVTAVSLRVALVPHMGTAGLLTGYTVGPYTVTVAKPRCHPAVPQDHCEPPHVQLRIPPGGIRCGPGRAVLQRGSGSEAAYRAESPDGGWRISRLVSAVGSASVS